MVAQGAYARPMSDEPNPGERLLHSWTANASAWTEVVRGGRIRSREGATDAAVLAAVSELAPETVLDVGCGEGWLTRALGERGCRVVGIDGSDELVRAARGGAGEFHVVAYDRLAAEEALVPGPFDVVVCNFSLLGDDLRPVLAALRRRTAPHGRLVIQTLHPLALRDEAPYRDGWREETFSGLREAFAEPMPWFFRTLESWFSALAGADLRVARVLEPRVEDDPLPASLLLVCTPGR